MKRLLCKTIIHVSVVLFALAVEPDLPSFDEYKSMKWMQRFRDDPFFRVDKRSMIVERRETTDGEFTQTFNWLEDGSEKKSNDVFNSYIHYFPANVLMIQAMYKLMKPNGVLNKEGFSHYGRISSDGSARILFSRAFASEHDLLDEINKAQGKRLTDLQVAIGDFDKKKPLVSVVNYILSPEDLEKVKNWLKGQEQKYGGHVRHSLKGNRVVLVIHYACCARASIQFLSPKYGTLKLSIG